MRAWLLVPLLILGISLPLGAQPPPPQLWFSKPLASFLDQPRLICLGWSKDGKVALLAPVDGGGRGGPVVRMLLLDTVEDTILFDREQWGDEFEWVSDEPGLLALNMEISAAGMDFISGCLEAAILPSAGTAASIASFPLSYQGLTLNARALAEPLGPKDDYGSRPLDYRIVVSSEGRGEKTILRSQVSHAFDITVEGYFLSPFEARMLVVYSLTQPGFEGDHSRAYFFSGSHLKLGFAKK